MPPFGMHMTLARELASRAGRPEALRAPGAYYLGATAPDIRALTKSDRAHTHFFNLTDWSEQSGVQGLFREHPELAEAGRLNESTTAFLCGYISHLEMDEAWICEIYRPCFGERSPLKGDLLANLLDRVLQFELDRRERHDPSAIADIRRDLLACAMDVETGFIDNEALVQWRDLLADVLCRPLEWERFGTVASRHLKAYGVESEADVAHFLRNIPDLLEQSIREVTAERLEGFLERARSRALLSIEQYLI